MANNTKSNHAKNSSKNNTKPAEKNKVTKFLSQSAAQNFSYDLRIPRERVAVLIGKNGEVKKTLEGETRTKMDIDSKEGEVVLSGRDALALYTAREIVRAIGRGFNPEVALRLLKQDNSFELVAIDDFATTKQAAERLKGRVIGAAGKARRVIETLTGANICVYGKTIGIIGEVEAVQTAKRAVENLLGGSPHSNVYKFLEKKRREMRRGEGNDPSAFIRDDLHKDLKELGM